MKTYPSLELDRLQTVLNNAGIDDHLIVGGIQLQTKGYSRLAAKMSSALNRHISVTEIGDMINQLINKVRSDQSLVAENYEAFMEDTDDRFTAEKDFLGNVTVRDSQTGTEVFLQGSKAAQLMYDVSQSDWQGKQDLLANAIKQNQGDLEEAVEDDSKSFMPEINAPVSNYNFLWRIGSESGTGNAEYYLKGKQAVIRLTSVRDSDGDEMDVSGNLENEIKQQAMAFIKDA